MFIDSLCNSKATSKQALLLHADGKKHRAKARAFHAANQPKQIEESTQNGNISTEDISKDESIVIKNVEEAKMQDSPQMTTVHDSLKTENENLASKKKRKPVASDNNGDKEKVRGDALGELGNGEVIQVERAEAEETVIQVKKLKHSVPEEPSCVKEDPKKKIKWKKLITSALKSVSCCNAAKTSKFLATIFICLNSYLMLCFFIFLIYKEQIENIDGLKLKTWPFFIP